MSLFREQFDRTAVPSLLQRFGDLVLYSDPDVSPAEQLTAKLTSEKQERRRLPTGWEVVTTRQARIQTSATDISFRLDGKLVVDGSKNYSIENVSQLTNGFTLLNLVRTETGEVTRTGYRGRSG